MENVYGKGRKGSWRMEHIQMQLQQLFDEIEQLENKLKERTAEQMATHYDMQQDRLQHIECQLDNIEQQIEKKKRIRSLRQYKKGGQLRHLYSFTRSIVTGRCVSLPTVSMA